MNFIQKLASLVYRRSLSKAVVDQRLASLNQHFITASHTLNRDELKAYSFDLAEAVRDYSMADFQIETMMGTLTHKLGVEKVTLYRNSIHNKMRISIHQSVEDDEPLNHVYIFEPSFTDEFERTLYSSEPAGVGDLPDDMLSLFTTVLLSVQDE